MNRRILVVFVSIFICLVFIYCFLDRSKKPDGYIISEKIWDNVPEHYIEAYFSRIHTMSDGLEVVAFLGKPKLMTRDKYPVVIFNRGGNRELGKIERPYELHYELIKAGYIVLATQYRGNDGSEGKEQFGGEDVHDVLNLIKTVSYLPYADTSNIFMVGHSRGGMMTYLALKEQPSIKAAVVMSGIADLFALAQERPEMETQVFNELIPHLPEKREDEYKKRSAIFWAEKINVPLLVLHGIKDWRVNINQTYALVDKLKLLQKKHLFISYESDHRITDKMIKDVIDWLNTFA